MNSPDTSHPASSNSEPDAVDRTAAANLQAILETVVDGIITIDERGRILSVNRAALNIFGHSLDELLGQNIASLMPSPHRERHDDYLREYLRTGVAHIIGVGREVQALRKDGTLVPIDLAVSEVHVEGGRLFTGIVRDMTERNRAQEALRRERTFSDSLLATAHAIVLVLDLDGRIVRFNSYLEELSGYRQGDVLGQNWFETFIPEAERRRIQALFDTTVAGTPVDGNVNHILTRSGRQRLVAWSACRLTDEQDVVTGVLAIGNDITALKEAEERMIQSERLAAIGQMVTGLAHESRNALQRARASLEMLQLDLPANTSTTKLTDQIATALDELRRLYEEVRAYAAPIHLDSNIHDIAELCQTVWNNLAPSCIGHDIQLRLQCEPGTGLMCCCDRERIKQVIRNILENSIAVAPDGSTISIDCMATIFHGRPALKAIIQDEGPGLTPEQQARAFEPFYTTKSKGTGLGLAIAQRVILAHRGDLTIGNGPQGGARAEIIIPSVPAAPLEADAAPPGTPRSSY
ncbi:MAG: PAS domain S-box protein [Planctomycetaceae bacterium]